MLQQQENSGLILSRENDCFQYFW